MLVALKMNQNRIKYSIKSETRNYIIKKDKKFVNICKGKLHTKRNVIKNCS